MSFDELKDKYRALPVWARLMMAVIIGILPGACSYLDEAEVLETQLSDATVKESEARAKFESNRKEKANIPKLEEELAYTEEQLEKAKKKLPEGYLIEDILTLTASNAKKSSVQLKSFEPTCELKGEADFKYVEFPIKVEVIGKFPAIASFFDRIVHSENMVFIREVDIERAGDSGEKSNAAPVVDSSAGAIVDRKTALAMRENLQLAAKFKLVVFRGMKDDEEGYFESKMSCDEDSENMEVPAMPPNIPAAEAPAGAAPTEAPAENSEQAG